MRKLLFPLLTIVSIALVGLFASFSKPGIYKLKEQTKSAAAPVTYYRDADNDTYGNPAVSLTWAVACENCGEPPTGYVTNNLDCDDNNASIKPGGTGGTCGLVAPLCGQVWADKNLDVNTYSDGTVIPNVTDNTDWQNLTTGAWCYYQNNSANGTIYGKLYNWYAVAGIYNAASLANPALRKKLAPAVFHIPTDAEWTTLGGVTCLGGDAVAGDKLKEAGIVHWAAGNAGTNISGFTGLPGGNRNPNGTFNDVGYYGYWWGSTQVNTTNAWSRYLGFGDGNLFRDVDDKRNGFSVRCLRD